MEELKAKKSTQTSTHSKSISCNSSEDVIPDIVNDCTLNISENITDDEPVLFMLENCESDKSELAKDKVLYAEQKTKDTVAAQRELGDWVEVEIDAWKQYVTCEGEEFSFGAYSTECAFFQILQFGILPFRYCNLVYFFQSTVKVHQRSVWIFDWSV